MDRTIAGMDEGSLAASAERPGFEDLYRKHVLEARRVAYLTIGDPGQAEDIVQDAFVRVFGRFADLRDKGAFRPYLLRTVVALSKNHLRRRTVERRYRPSAPDAVANIPERDLELLSSLRRLPYRQKVAVVLRYCEDLSEAETAEILRTTPKAVQSLTRRALAALRKEVPRWQP